ncbi:tryptophan synthase subunit alpha [Bacillus carboniphilus]|uniref:Tryptophan synthase alpha chain n=1 Tax=Bacillus carboniphilus TaxID=86663 RepID=A0ABN0W8U5_9BACI
MGKERIEKAIQQVIDNGDKAFIPYIMAGDGGLEKLEDQLLFLQNSGATVVELGVPFSDPVADGPTIQAAGLRALKAGVTLDKLLRKLKEIKDSIEVPVVLMTYINPLLQYGVEKLAIDAKAAGVSGFIIPDVPMEEEGIIAPYLSSEELALIRLVTITSPIERIKEIVSHSDGFVYAVTVAGITGARATLQSTLDSYLQKVKEVSPVPVLAGFGISTPEQVKQTSQHCDGVIVGSKVIEFIRGGKDQELVELIGASRLGIAVE